MYTEGKIENPNALENVSELVNGLVKQSKAIITIDDTRIGPFSTIKYATASANELRGELVNLICGERESAQLSALGSLRNDLLWGGCGIDPAPCFASDEALELAKDIAANVKCDDKHHERVIAEHASDKKGLQAIVCFLVTLVWVLFCILICRNHSDVAAGISCLGFIPLIIGISIGMDWWCNNGW